MRYLTSLPLLAAAGGCMATGMLVGVVTGAVLAAMGFDLLRRGG